MLLPDCSCVRWVLLPPRETPLWIFLAVLTPQKGSPHGLMLAGVCGARGCGGSLSEQRRTAVGLDGGLEEHRVQRSKGCGMEEAQGPASTGGVKPGGASGRRECGSSLAKCV